VPMNRNNMGDIETFVRLKYRIATGGVDWADLSGSYPIEVRTALVNRWDNWNEKDPTYLNSFSYEGKWALYISWLVEELCKYEQRN
jgi:hypothetical protein